MVSDTTQEGVQWRIEVADVQGAEAQLYLLRPSTDETSALAITPAPPYRALVLPGSAEAGHLWRLTPRVYCELGE
jgi:hypothetical protein